MRRDPPADANREFEALQRKLAPDVIRTALMRAAIFLAGWELLKGEVLDGVKNFFLMGFDANGYFHSPEYESDVLARHPSRFEASLLWLIDTGALGHHHAQRIRNLRSTRNEIAHELPKLLVDPRHEVSTELLEEMRLLLGILGRFWGKIEVDINPDFDGVNIDDAGIKSGAMLLMDHLLEAASALSFNDAMAEPNPAR